MKIFTVVGIRKSGKTTTVTQLIQEYKRRGLRVGTVKNVFCPGFTIDSQGTNTWRHREAGADLIGVRGKAELDLIWPKGDEQALYRFMPVDVLILEGDYQAAVPRIVCGRKEPQEIRERQNAHTIAVCGQISGTIGKEYQGIPVYDALTQIQELADYILKTVPEAEFPLEMEGIPEHTSAFCQCGCHKNEKKLQMSAQEPLKEHPGHMGFHVFLTGEKQVGKSTLLKKIRARFAEEFQLKEVGYETRSYQVEGRPKGYVLHSLVPLEEEENDCPFTIRTGSRKMIPIPETFDTVGVKMLAASMKAGEPEKILFVADEIGKAERAALEFQKELFGCLDSLPFAVGVLQKSGKGFVQAVAERSDVRVYEVTEKNRDSLEEQIVEEFLLHWRRQRQEK